MRLGLERIKAVMLGHAVGDALGVPVEFLPREALDADPVFGMRGYGSHPVPAGAWSDDTSMSLAAMEALCVKKWSFDGVMEGFVDWLENAKYTPTGRVFDVGVTCSRAICRYEEGCRPATACGQEGARSNGNGSLMRIHPFVLYAYATEMPLGAWRELIEDASALTHAHERSRVGCLIYAFLLMHLLSNPTRGAIDLALRRAECHLGDYGELAAYRRIFAESFANIPRNGIKSSGYVVDTLEAALWCLLNTDSYRDCVLAAVDLGEDTDTVAAVAGGLAGALYGYDAIPKEWLAALLCRADIERLCRRAATAWG